MEERHKHITETFDKIRRLHDELNGAYAQISMYATLLPYVEAREKQLLAFVERYRELSDFDQQAKDEVDQNVDAWLQENGIELSD